MDISFSELRNKEIVNLCNGSRMGHIIDVVFNSDSGKVSGIVVPGEKKIFKKSGDLFVPIEKIRRIGDDVILVRFETPDMRFNRYGLKDAGVKMVSNKIYSDKSRDKDGSYIRYRKLDNKKYK